jgi:hypothetical protein
MTITGLDSSTKRTEQAAISPSTAHLYNQQTSTNAVRVPYTLTWFLTMRPALERATAYGLGVSFALTKWGIKTSVAFQTVDIACGVCHPCCPLHFQSRVTPPTISLLYFVLVPGNWFEITGVSAHHVQSDGHHLVTVSRL